MPKHGKLKMLALLAAGSNATLTTEFLSRNQFSEFGSWLKTQDPVTMRTYFGCILAPEAIDALIEKFSNNSKTIMS